MLHGVRCNLMQQVLKTVQHAVDHSEPYGSPDQARQRQSEEQLFKEATLKQSNTANRQQLRCKTNDFGAGKRLGAVAGAWPLSLRCASARPSDMPCRVGREWWHRQRGPLPRCLLPLCGTRFGMVRCALCAASVQVGLLMQERDLLLREKASLQVGG